MARPHHHEIVERWPLGQLNVVQNAPLQELLAIDNFDRQQRVDRRFEIDWKDGLSDFDHFRSAYNLAAGASEAEDLRENKVIIAQDLRRSMTAKLDNAIALYMEGIRDGNARYAVEKYTGDRYTQHSAGVRDGVEGFVEFFEPFIERNPVRDIQIIRGIEDGQYVFLQAYQDINNGEAKWVTTDFFDTDGDHKIIEHWDIIAPYVATTPSGHTAIDGPTEVEDLDKTEENKAVVREMITQVFIPGGDPTRVGEFIADEYVQHNPEVADGLESFRPLVVAPDNPLVYSEIVLLVGQGNFVATLCKASFHGDPYAQCDIFRLQDGLIVEHWDNAEAIGPEAEWVNSGKF